MKVFVIFCTLLFTIVLIGEVRPQNIHHKRKKKGIYTKLPDWVIKKDLIVNSKSEPRNEFISELMRKLESSEGIGNQVTKEEFLKLFERPESRHVYKDKLIKYATPKSMTIQNTEHEDRAYHLLQEEKLPDGVDFLKRYWELLNKAESKYNVYKQDLVSILMWESELGKFTGNNRVFNIFMAQILFLDAAQKFAINNLRQKEGILPLADSSLIVSEKKRLIRRKSYSVDGLASVLRYCKKRNLDPFEQKGSWGGAIGYVQFMPFNLQYAVDADTNGVIDLNSWPDAI
jgi:membrane-bound lytic murein transglycosylase B